MGGYGFRETNLGAAILNDHIVGDHSSDERPKCEVRDVSGLKPWERAKWIAAKMKAERVKK
jgi:hypothetical protein